MNRETHHLDVLKRSWNGFLHLPRISAAKCPSFYRFSVTLLLCHFFLFWSHYRLLCSLWPHICVFCQAYAKKLLMVSFHLPPAEQLLPAFPFLLHVPSWVGWAPAFSWPCALFALQAFQLLGLCFPLVSLVICLCSIVRSLQ